MNAIEIKNLSKSFGQKMAVNGLNMTVPVGAIYGFIGQNGSGKSTTEKLICGLLTKTSGEIKIYGKDGTDSEVRATLGCLIEAPGCYPNYSVWNNLMLQAKNLCIENPKEEIARVLKIVRMEGSASNKFKNCSLGMKQRIGIAMSLMGSPKLLVLDEPINGLDADGMRIMRDVLVDIAQNLGCTVIISSHILGELEKIATHYGIIKDGKMVKEMTSAELDAECGTYVALQAKDMKKAINILRNKYQKVVEENDSIRVYDAVEAERIVDYLYQNNCIVTAVETEKISLEEYYAYLLNGGIET